MPSGKNAGNIRTVNQLQGILRLKTKKTDKGEGTEAFGAVLGKS